MNDTLKQRLLENVELNVESSEFYEFHDGTAMVINHKTLYWFNSSHEIVFKFYPSMHFITAHEIIGIIKVNNWLKVYFIDNMVLHVLADNQGYMMKNGSYLCYYSETWDMLLSKAEVNNNILSLHGQSITFKHKIDNIQYYDNGFILLANSHEQTCEEKWLTLYSVSSDCKLRWKMVDYTKTNPTCEGKEFKLINDRIESFIIKEDLIYADTFNSIRLKIDAKTGKTISCSSFAWLK